MRPVDKEIEENKEYYSTLENIVVRGHELTNFRNKRWSRNVDIQLFIDDKGNIVKARTI